MLAVVHTGTMGRHFLVRFTIAELRVIHRTLPVKRQYVFRLFQRCAVGIEKSGAAFLVPHPFIAQHIKVGS